MPCVASFQGDFPEGRSSKQAEPELPLMRPGGKSRCCRMGVIGILGLNPSSWARRAAAAPSWAGQAAPLGICAVIPPGSRRVAQLSGSQPSQQRVLPPLPNACWS